MIDLFILPIKFKITTLKASVKKIICSGLSIFITWVTDIVLGERNSVGLKVVLQTLQASFSGTKQK